MLPIRRRPLPVAPPVRRDNRPQSAARIRSHDMASRIAGSRLCDCRQPEQPSRSYGEIVGVGMIEAYGAAQLSCYSSARLASAQTGQDLSESWDGIRHTENAAHSGPFVNTYVFPSAERALISTTTELAEPRGLGGGDIEFPGTFCC